LGKRWRPTRDTLFESVLYVFRKPTIEPLICELELANNSGEETIIHTDLQFGTVEEVIQAEVQFAKLIDNAMQELLDEK
jgi:hypothetical protein